MSAPITIPNGKGNPPVPIAQATDTQLQKFIKWQEDDLAKNPDSRWAESNRAKIDACKAELGARKSGKKREPTVAEQSQSQAIERAQQVSIRPAQQGVSLEKAIHDPSLVSARLKELATSFHLVTPVTSVDALPPGCGVSISYVQVNPDPSLSGPREVYSIGSGDSARLALSVDTLKRVAAAAGVDWDPSQTGRLDDGSDPHYCHYRAVGFVRSFDGSLRTVTGEVEIDARDGSPQIDEIMSKAQKAINSRTKQPEPRDPRPQIMELRKFLLRHAESKAKNRAIADMGLKRSYAPAELEKPFAVARIVWTGETDDPELKREFARMHAERMMDGAAALYGRQRPALPQRRHTIPQFQGHPPPVDDLPPDPDDDDGATTTAVGSDVTPEAKGGDVAGQQPLKV